MPPESYYCVRYGLGSPASHETVPAIWNFLSSPAHGGGAEPTASHLGLPDAAGRRLGNVEKSRGFWRATNHRGVFVPSGRGIVSNLACAKVIFSETGDGSRQDWGQESMYFPLSPEDGELPPLTAKQEDDMAAEFQPEFLMYRLRHLHFVNQDMFTSTRPRLLGFELGRSLLACVEDEPKIVNAVSPLLEAHEQELLERRFLDPRVAILEAVWTPAHEGKEISTARIAERVNALLRNRGESQVYNAREIGRKLRSLGLPRLSNGSNKVLRFSREICQRIHRLAAQFGLDLPKMMDCPDCQATQPVVQ
jgi:hypothetical protein